MGALMGHTGAGFPMFNDLNTHWPAWVMELSGVVEQLMSFMLIWICSILLTKHSRQFS